MLRRTDMETNMFTKILAASTLALGLATSAAMAQTVVTDDGVYSSSTTTVVPDDTMTVDPATTQSIYPDTSMMPTGQDAITPMGPCADNTQGPDANSTGMVNDQYCGK
jgi:hypothetical protein